jgi:multidrug efflux pump subunit AcrB
MIRALARAAVANPVAINLGTLVLCLAGLFTWQSMPREVFPVFTMNQVRVATVYPGATPEDVERLVTRPLEDAVEGIEGLTELYSTSREGYSTLLLELSEETDAGTFIEEVRTAVNRGDLNLPAEVEAPEVREMKSEFPVIAVFIYGWLPEAELHQVAEDHRRRLEGIEGVSRIVVEGLREPRLWIEVERLALERFGLTLADVGRVVNAGSRDAPLGSLTSGAHSSGVSGDTLLRVDAELEDVEHLLALPLIAGADGSLVRLGQVAKVSENFARPITRARFNGQPCIHMQINKEESGDTIDIAREVRAYVAGALEGMPTGCAIGTNGDVSIYVKNRLQVMKESGAIGGFLVVLSLLAFLQRRVALMTALGIPISFLGGLVIASAFGVSMNMVTMFAFIVVLGMIVDDAIVVGENAYRLMEEGLDPESAAIESAAEVGAPVLATILTSIAAFMPVLMISGTTGNFMRPLPLVVTFCLLVSLVEALCVLPSHLAHWTSKSALRRRAAENRTDWYDPLRRHYSVLLELAVRWRYVSLTMVSVVCLVLVSIAVFRVPFVLFDDFESKIFYVNMRMDPSSSLEETGELTRPVEAALLELPRKELESLNTLIGVSALDANRFTIGRNLAQAWVELKEGGERTRPTAQVIESVRARFTPPPPGIESISIAQPQAGPTGAAIQVAVRGPELEVLAEIAALLKADLATFAGVRDIRDDLIMGKRELRLRLKEEARLLGFTEAGVAAELRAAFEGTAFGSVRKGRDQVDLVVKFPEAERSRPAEFDSVRLTAPGGARVPLSMVVETSVLTGPTEITRLDRERAVSVIADVNKEEGNAAKIVVELGRRHRDLGTRFPGYELEFQGDQRETERSFGGLKSAFALSLLLIYMILGSLFRSFSQPLVIMFIIPFGAMGMIFGHLAMDRPISIMSLIGLLALTGVVVNDSLILVEFVNSRRRAGMAMIAAVLEAGRLRFRPILLTSLTTMLGLAPLTFFATGQARFLQPMAITMFFGLGLATFLVLLIVPCAYAVLEDGLAWARSPAGVWRSMRRGAVLHREDAAGSALATSGEER